tara:strand:- start:36952 stop:37158 length:207 start_codon:yes stop_codon:yes gene_type:complete
MELYETDYVILYYGEPSEPLDVIYHYTSIIEMINDGGLSLAEGEEIVSMTKLPQELQDKYIKTIKENK